MLFRTANGPGEQSDKQTAKKKRKKKKHEVKKIDSESIGMTEMMENLKVSTRGPCEQIIQEHNQSHLI